MAEKEMLYTCPNGYLTENVFPLTLTLNPYP